MWQCHRHQKARGACSDNNCMTLFLRKKYELKFVPCTAHMGNVLQGKGRYCLLIQDHVGPCKYTGEP